MLEWFSEQVHCRQLTLEQHILCGGGGSPQETLVVDLIHIIIMHLYIYTSWLYITVFIFEMAI